METIQDKMNQIDTHLSLNASLAARGMLPAGAIAKLSKKEMRQAILAARAYNLLDEEKHKAAYHKYYIA